MSTQSLTSLITPTNGLNILGGGLFSPAHSTRLIDTTGGSGSGNAYNAFNAFPASILQFKNSTSWSLGSGSRLNFPAVGTYAVSLTLQYAAPGGTAYGVNDYLDFSFQDDTGAFWFGDRSLPNGAPAGYYNNKIISGEVVITSANLNNCFFAVKNGLASSQNTITIFIKAGSIRRVL